MKLCFSTLGCAERSLTDIFALARAYRIPCLEFRGIGGIIDNREIPDLRLTVLPKPAPPWIARG